MKISPLLEYSLPSLLWSQTNENNTRYYTRDFTVYGQDISKTFLLFHFQLSTISARTWLKSTTALCSMDGPSVTRPFTGVTSASRCLSPVSSTARRCTSVGVRSIRWTCWHRCGAELNRSVHVSYRLTFLFVCV